MMMPRRPIPTETIPRLREISSITSFRAHLPKSVRCLKLILDHRFSLLISELRGSPHMLP
jgi:hypothetical protein